MDSEELERIIRKIAKMDLIYDAMGDAGSAPEAEYKVYQAKRTELIQALEEERGTTDVTYAQFRTAFDDGAACDVLVALKNGMHPKDPLRNDAVKDLRSVGCFSRTSKRRRRKRPELL